MICLFSTSFSHGSNLSNLVRILFKLRDKLSHTASPRHGSGGISPRRRISFRTAGSCLSRIHSTSVLRRLALFWSPQLLYFLVAYPLELSLPQSWGRTGRWGWISGRSYLWILSTASLSVWWTYNERSSHYEKAAPQDAPEGSPEQVQ